MALYDNNNRGTRTAKKEYATDPEGMMKDAKEYASRDYSTVLATVREIGKEFEGVNDILTDEVIAKALIQVKYDQIVKARTERVSFFD